MKKLQLIFGVSILALLIGCTISPKSNESGDTTVYIRRTTFPVTFLKKDSVKYKYTPEEVDFLRHMNMTGSKTFIDNISLADSKIAERYFIKFKLRYLSNEFVKSFLQKDSLIIGELSDYKGIIPPDNIDEFKKNYEHILTTDSKFKDAYYIRISRLATQNPGKFLQIINKKEIQPSFLNFITGGAGFGIHPQVAYENHKAILFPNREEYYAQKYNISLDDLVVDHNTGGYEVKIIADKSMFNLDGKTIINNEIKTKPVDPAIILHVQDGWLVLTTWK